MKLTRIDLEPMAKEWTPIRKESLEKIGETADLENENNGRPLYS
jgi:hypothetical protein